MRARTATSRRTSVGVVAWLEMDLPVGQAVERLSGRESYTRAFREAFGRDVNGADLARALAAYVRTIEAGDAPYDRYVWGERDALSPEARDAVLGRLATMRTGDVFLPPGPEPSTRVRSTPRSSAENAGVGVIAKVVMRGAEFTAVTVLLLTAAPSSSPSSGVTRA